MSAEARYFRVGLFVLIGIVLLGIAAFGALYYGVGGELQNLAEGILVDAVILSEVDVNLLFGFSRSYFHVDLPTVGATVSFIRSLLPKKRLNELYTMLGRAKQEQGLDAGGEVGVEAVVVEARVALLATATLGDVLRAAAVLGKTFEFSELAAVAEQTEDELLDAVDVLVSPEEETPNGAGHRGDHHVVFGE